MTSGETAIFSLAVALYNALSGRSGNFDSIKGVEDGKILLQH
jgi:hypothetical protein